MTETLALKYRPKTLDELVGQESIKTALSNAIKDDKLGKTLLFSGIRGTGKTSTARILAASINCLNVEKPTINPCGKCRSCQGINTGTDMDVIEKDIADDPSVDGVREISQNILSSPISRKRIYILDEVHQWSKSAQGAALKLLEEPPSHALFILCTTEPQKLLDTIRSRCIHFPFKAVGNDQIAGHLQYIIEVENITIEESAVKLLVNLSGGSLRDCLSLLDRVRLETPPITTAKIYSAVNAIPENLIMDLIEVITEGNIVLALEKVELITAEEGFTPQEVTNKGLSLLTEIYKLKAGYPNDKLIISDKERATKLAENLDNFTLNCLIQSLNEAHKNIQYAGEKKAIWLEVAVLNLMMEIGKL